ncbi:MAG: pirin family protein [Gammaproteobacteria bacterium]
MSKQSREVSDIVAGQAASDGAGVRLYRVIGGAALSELDPFLLLDEFVSDNPDDYLAGFPDHPHRGFETVTYMLAGRMRHADNQGNSGLLEAGSVQWMTAGRGIVHSEMPEQENGLMWGFQLWVNLPARNKLCPPRYQDIAPAAIPAVTRADGTRVRVIAGRFDDRDGPVGGIDAAPSYFDVALPAAGVLDVPLPRGHTAFVYCYDGALTIGRRQPTALPHRHLAVLGDGDAVTLTADTAAARALVVAGRPFEEPIARYGPFVMNTREEIMAAIDDLRAGRF